MPRNTAYTANDRELSADPLRVLRARQVAKLLGVHEITIWKWAKLGRLPQPIKIGPAVTAWRATDIESWLEAKRRGDPA